MSRRRGGEQYQVGDQPELAGPRVHGPPGAPDFGPGHQAAGRGHRREEAEEPLRGLAPQLPGTRGPGQDCPGSGGGFTQTIFAPVDEPNQNVHPFLLTSVVNPDKFIQDPA